MLWGQNSPRQNSALLPPAKLKGKAEKVKLFPSNLNGSQNKCLEYLQIYKNVQFPRKLNRFCNQSKFTKYISLLKQL